MKLQLIAGGALVALLAGCADDPVNYREHRYYGSSYGPAYYGSSYEPAYAPTAYYGDRYAYNGDYARVTSIEVVRGGGRGGTSGGGAILGGIAGGVIGHQIGSGRGNDAATVAGAIGGAIVGNEIEKDRRAERDMYRVTVRNRNGNQETYMMESLGGLRVGDRVRLDGGRIYPIG